MLLHTVKNKLEGEGETRSLIKPAGRPFPTRHRQAKETKCGEMGGRESERPIVTLRRGNSTEGPRGVKGTPFQLTVGGKHGGCIGTRGRVHETTTDSGSRRLKRGAVCVNCASTDLWGAWVGDHPGLPGDRFDVDTLCPMRQSNQMTWISRADCGRPRQQRFGR